MNPHEEQFVRAFIIPEKRARYLSLLESERGRSKLLDGFNHCHDLDPRFAKPIPPNQQSARSIETILRHKGAPDTCYVMSDNPQIDSREMSLSDALLETTTYWIASGCKNLRATVCLLERFDRPMRL